VIFLFLEGDYMNTVILKFIVVTIGIITTAIGATLGLKAAIGVSAFDALSQSASTVLDVKIGTFTMILNISCVLVQLLLLKKDFKLNHALQVFVSILLGFVVNFMFYDVFSKLTINSYFTSMFLFILSVIICAIGVSMIMALNFVSFPLESCCMVVANKLNKKFGSIRQLVDVICIIIAISIALAFKNRITVREGTIIGMLVYGPMIDLFINLMKPGLRKLNLVD
jgi:uncharacterized membrane protein YczE